MIAKVVPKKGGCCSLTQASRPGSPAVCCVPSLASCDEEQQINLTSRSQPVNPPRRRSTRGVCRCHSTEHHLARAHPKTHRRRAAPTRPLSIQARPPTLPGQTHIARNARPRSRRTPKSTKQAEQSYTISQRRRTTNTLKLSLSDAHTRVFSLGPNSTPVRLALVHIMCLF